MKHRTGLEVQRYTLPTTVQRGWTSHSLAQANADRLQQDYPGFVRRYGRDLFHAWRNAQRLARTRNGEGAIFTYDGQAVGTGTVLHQQNIRRGDGTTLRRFTDVDYWAVENTPTDVHLQIADALIELAARKVARGTTYLGDTSRERADDELSYRHTRIMAAVREDAVVKPEGVIARIQDLGGVMLEGAQPLTALPEGAESEVLKAGAPMNVYVFDSHPDIFGPIE